MKNIFELAKEENEKRLINQTAIQETFRNDKWRNKIAGALYSAAYGDADDFRYFTTGVYPANEILNRFCDEVFGVCFQDVMDAYDKYLG